MSVEVKPRWVVPALAIALAGAAAYLPAFSAGFVFDDHTLVESNRLLRGPLWRVWADKSATDYWPLTWTSFWLESRVWGDRAWGYHAVNVALHVGAAILLWRTLRRLGVPGAWFAGVLFAIHPVTVESVAWISEQKNTLSAIFFLGAILAWVRDDRRARDRLVALSLFLLALLSKASVVMLPFVLLAISVWSSGRLDRRDLLETAPFFAMSLVVGLVNVWFQRQNAMVGGWAPSHGIGERFGGAGWALASYAETALLPARVAVLYPEWPVGPGSPLFFLPLAAVVVLFAMLWAARRRWTFARPALLALSYHALMLLPVLGFVDISYFRIAPVANHLQYLALMGPVALTAAAAAWCARRFPFPASAAATVLVVVLAAFTSRRAAAYEGDMTLWQRAVAEAPQNAAAHYQLSQLLLQAGRVPEALGEMEASARLARAPGAQHRALSLWHFYAGRDTEAAAEARQVLRVTDDPELRRDAAFVLTSTGYGSEAVGVFEKLVRNAPSSSDYTYWLAAALSRSGRWAEAADVLRSWCAERPGNPKMEEALSFVLVRLGLVGEARQHASSVLGTNPGDPRVDAWLANLASQGR
jgi:tetratricopeptide (TPR) repeat protein